MKGISSLLAHKKWVFSYLLTGLSFWQLESGDIALVLAVLIPITLGASSFDKSVYRHRDDK